MDNFIGPISQDDFPVHQHRSSPTILSHVSSLLRVGNHHVLTVIEHLGGQEGSVKLNRYCWSILVYKEALSPHSSLFNQSRKTLINTIVSLGHLDQFLDLLLAHDLYSKFSQTQSLVQKTMTIL